MKPEWQRTLYARVVQAERLRWGQWQQQKYQKGSD